MTTTHAVGRWCDAGVPFAARRAVRRRSEKARLERRDAPDPHACGSLPSDQPRWNEGRVLVSAEWQDAHLRRRCERRDAASRCATTAARSRNGHRRGDQILYVTRHDPSGVGLLKIGSSHNDAWLRHPGYGIYNPRRLVGWRLDRVQRQDRQAGSRARLRREGSRIRGCARERMDRDQSAMARRRAGRHRRIFCISGRIATARRACGRSVSIRRRSGRPGRR